jgi:hypothetical protein
MMEAAGNPATRHKVSRLLQGATQQKTVIYIIVRCLAGPTKEHATGVASNILYIFLVFISAFFI